MMKIDSRTVPAQKIRHTWQKHFVGECSIPEIRASRSPTQLDDGKRGLYRPGRREGEICENVACESQILDELERIQEQIRREQEGCRGVASARTCGRLETPAIRFPGASVHKRR